MAGLAHRAAITVLCADDTNDTFLQTLETIRTAAGVGAKLRETLERDEAEVIAQTLLEKAMQDTVMSFQRVSEQFYERRTGRSAKRNAFQRLDTGWTCRGLMPLL